MIGAVNDAAGDRRTSCVCAAGSLPGDLHKLWRPATPKSYHLEYGYSCMGYEIAGGLGVKMAEPDREVYVMVGDGSYLMMAQEIVTAVQEGIKLTSCCSTTTASPSIGGLSESVGADGSAPYRTAYRDPAARRRRCRWTSPPTPPAWAPRSCARDTLDRAARRWRRPRGRPRRTVIYVRTDPLIDGPASEAWWDVPVAEVSATAAGRTSGRSTTPPGRTVAGT